MSRELAALETRKRLRSSVMLAEIVRMFLRTNRSQLQDLGQLRRRACWFLASSEDPMPQLAREGGSSKTPPPQFLTISRLLLGRGYGFLLTFATGLIKAVTNLKLA
jgi:hypothetical protein